MIFFIYFTFSASNIHCLIQKSNGITIFKNSCSNAKRFGQSTVSYSGLLECISQYFCKFKACIVSVIVSGFHFNRFLFLQSFFDLISRFQVSQVFFLSSRSFNGCRIRKKRRLLVLLFGQMSEWFIVLVLKTNKDLVSFGGSNPPLPTTVFIFLFNDCTYFVFSTS